MRILTAAGALALVLTIAGPAQAAPVGHRVERLVVAGAAQGEPRAVDVQLWYPADAASAAARPLTTYSSALNGRQLIPGKAPLTWSFAAELAREGATVAATGGPYPVIVFSHGNNNDPIDYAHTLERIAAEGFIVAAPGHTNNSQEEVRIDFANLQGATPPIPCNDGRPSPCSRTDVALSLTDRVRDVSAVISAVPGWFGTRADAARVGVLGHSRGTVTALAAAGGSTTWGFGRDPRVQAIMGMSIGVQAITSAVSLNQVRVPIFLIAGELDATSLPSVSQFALDQSPSTDKRPLMIIPKAYHRTFDSTYCKQLQSSGTIAAANPNAVLDRQTFDQIAAHVSSGRAVDYCNYSTFTDPGVRGLVQTVNNFTVTPTNVPTSGLDTDTVKPQIANLAVEFFGAKLARAASGELGGSVAATLSLTLGPNATFGAFTPGVTREYMTTTSANVISTAGDAALTVSDPGRMTNGTFSLPQPLRVEIAPASWSTPVSNAPATITFRQSIAATDALRTGTYSRTLTFTLSTTTP